MTLGAFLTACGTADAIITVKLSTDVIAKLTPGSVGALSDTAKAYTVSSFTISNSKELLVTVTA